MSSPARLDPSHQAASPPPASGLRRFCTRRHTPLRHTPAGKSYSRPGPSQKSGRNDVAGYLKRSAKKEQTAEITKTRRNKQHSAELVAFRKIWKVLMERAISDDGHRIYHMLIRHGLRFGCIIIIGVCSHVSARCTCFEHVTSFMKSMTQMAEERSSHDSSTNECARIQWCIRMNPGPDSSRECCRGIRCDYSSRTSDRAFCPLRRHQYQL